MKIQNMTKEKEEKNVNLNAHAFRLWRNKTITKSTQNRVKFKDFFL